MAVLTSKLRRAVYWIEIVPRLLAVCFLLLIWAVWPSQPDPEGSRPLDTISPPASAEFAKHVFHDFDNPHPSGRWAIRHGFALIVYGVTKRFNRPKWLKRKVAYIAQMNYEYAFTLAMIDRLLGIPSIFGIHDRVAKEFPNLISDLRKLGVDVHRHWHVSPTEVRWDPAVHLPTEYWWMDQEIARGVRTVKSTDRFLQFHCDYPHFLHYYIEALTKAKKEGSL